MYLQTFYTGYIFSMHSVSTLCNILKTCHKLHFVSQVSILVQAQLIYPEDLSPCKQKQI